MKEIYYTTTAKKDLKKYRHDTKKMKALREVLLMLANGIKLPDKYLLHKLKGKYKNCHECHIQGDFLLIWIENDKIQIIRIGTHSELFE